MEKTLVCVWVISSAIGEYGVVAAAQTLDGRAVNGLVGSLVRIGPQVPDFWVQLMERVGEP